MKIAIFSWEALHACEIGGVSAHVSGLSAALAHLGHEVHLFTREAPGYLATDMINGVYYHRCPWTRHNGFIDEVRAFNHSLMHYFRETAAAIGGFNVLHCHDWLTFPAGLRLREAGDFDNGCRWIATFHTTERGRSGGELPNDEAKRIARWEQDTVDNTDALILISNEIRRQVQDAYNNPLWKSQIIYYGISTLPPARLTDERAIARAALGLTPIEPVALFVGTLSERKGADVLIDSLDPLFAAAPEAKLLIAGNGPLLPKLQEALHNGRHTERVIFAPIAETRQIASLYHAADAVAIPYRYDPFGIVGLSAWAAAKPYVVCHAGAAAEFVYDKVNGYKVSPLDFGTVLGELLTDGGRCRQLGENGRVAVDTIFSWKAVAEQTLAMYRGDNERFWRGKI